jgi:hypothetical protein
MVGTVLLVLRTEGLVAAVEQTGHSHDIDGRWMRRLSAHAEAVTATLEREGLSVEETAAF